MPHKPSPFYQDSRPPAPTPGQEKIAQPPAHKHEVKVSWEGPSRSQLEEWYTILNDFVTIDPVDHTDLESVRDVRDDIYAFLH